MVTATDESAGAAEAPQSGHHDTGAWQWYSSIQNKPEDDSRPEWPRRSGVLLGHKPEDHPYGDRNQIDGNENAAGSHTDSSRAARSEQKVSIFTAAAAVAGGREGGASIIRRCETDV